MANKITKAQMFAQIREVVADNADMVAFIDHELDLLAKKASAKKPTKVQTENLTLMEKIVEVLGTFENGATASEVLTASEDFKGLTNQKISALLKKLVDDKRVTKTMDKRKAIFSV